MEFLSQRVTEVCNIAKSAGCFLPPLCTDPGRKKKPGYISKEHPHMQFMDRILQGISENLSPLCCTNQNLFYFYAWKAFTLLKQIILSKLENKVLTFFSERKGLKIILREHHFHTGWTDYSSSHGISCMYLKSSHKTSIVSYEPLSFFLSGQVSTLHIPWNPMDADLDQMMKW